ncbi:MAG: MBL fold metallo-hydrolase, partial [Actinomycetia bacterium]|nr:MBL fold metallo-hydrolase [Actinomycetes bacterium]
FERACRWFSGFGGAALSSSALPVAALAGWLALMLGIWVAWVTPTPSRARRLAAAGLAVIVLVSAVPLARPGSGTLQRGVVILDVGQGDALLVCDGGHAGLIDTGPSPTALKEQLRAQKVTRLDFVLFTHGHSDHVGGAPALDRSLHITHLYVAEGAQRSKQLAAVSTRLDVPLTGMHGGQSFMLGHIRITAIWPRSRISDPDANESCLTTLLTDELPDARDKVATDTLLTSGDAEAPTVSAAITAAHITQVDVLKAPHHGSAISLSDALLDRLRPALVVISCGLKNPYGHPKPATLDFLQKHGIPFKRTDHDGPVLVPF